jgi:hypothetical protein
MESLVAERVSGRGPCVVIDFPPLSKNRWLTVENDGQRIGDVRRAGAAGTGSIRTISRRCRM